MDLKELKKTWSKLSTEKELDEEQIRAMLRKRTHNLIERIDRNIRIGFVILFALIFAFAFDDLFFSPLLMKNINANLAIPDWLLFLSFFSNAFIFITFVYFVIQYYRVKRRCNISCELKETLVKIIDTLNIYRRMFYLALVTLLFAVGSAFVSGMYKGFVSGVEKHGMIFSEVPSDKLVIAIVVGLVILIFVVGGIFLILRWGFRKLYGNYIKKLKFTLKELEEINE